MARNLKSLFVTSFIIGTYLHFWGYSANLTEWPWWTVFAFFIIEAVVLTVWNGVPSPDGKGRSTVAGGIFVIAVLGTIFFAASVVYDVYEISDEGGYAHQALSNGWFILMNHLEAERDRDAVFLGVFVIASIISGTVRRRAARKLSTNSGNWDKFLDTEAVKSGPDPSPKKTTSTTGWLPGTAPAEARVNTSKENQPVSDDPSKQVVSCPGCTTKLSLPAGKTGRNQVPPLQSNI